MSDQSTKLTVEDIDRLNAEIDSIDKELIELENKAIALHSRREAIRLIFLDELKRYS